MGVSSVRLNARENTIRSGQTFAVNFSKMEEMGYRDKDGLLVLPSEYDDGEDWSEYDDTLQKVGRLACEDEV